jgi:hypothetical protein
MVKAVTTGAWMSLKVAVRVVLPFKVRVQLPVPEHPPPDQPAKEEPVPGEAVAVIWVPEGYEPAPVTVPAPVPAVVMARL